MGFECPTAVEDVFALRERIRALEDGMTLRCRGRDAVGDAWDYGHCTKQGECLTCTYISGDQEFLLVSKVNLRLLLQVEFPTFSAGMEGTFVNDAGAGIPEAGFFQPSVEDGSLQALRAHLRSVPDGTCLACRGRNSFTDRWDYGYCVKDQERLHFFYDSGDREVLCIQAVRFNTLVQVVVPSAFQPALEAPLSGTPQGFAVIAHGFSPECGPDYRLIKRLAATARSRGLHVVIPDFRQTYSLCLGAGRHERIRMLKAELMGCRGASFIALVGHSQGGRASANVCTDAEVLALPLRGCMMLGAEDPMELGELRPMVPDLSIVHAAGDGIISSKYLLKRAEAWHVPFIELKSEAPESTKDPDGDDINHGFLAADLMPVVEQIYGNFLDRCAAASWTLGPVADAPSLTC